MSAPYWSVVQTYSDRRAVDEIARVLPHPLNCYRPMCRYWSERGPVVGSLFPGYVLLFADYVGRNLVSSLRSVAQLLGGERPTEVPVGEVLRLTAAEGPDGIIELREETAPKKRQRFRKGQPVRVSRGLGVGMVGVFDKYRGEERVQVLMSFLGRSTPVMMRTDELTVI